MRALVTFLVFAIAGPPIGALIPLAAIVTAIFYGPEAAAPFRGTAEEFAKVVALVVAVAYLFGGLQALFVAIVAAATQALRWTGRASFLAVVIAGLVTGIGFVSLMVSHSNTPFLSIQSLIFLGVHVGAAIGCWLITQGILRLLRRAPAGVA